MAVVANAAASTLQEGVWGLATSGWLAAREVSFATATAIKYLALANGAARRPAAKQERARQCELLRDICGPLPFRRVNVEPSLLTSNSGVVLKLAAAIYEDRSFDRMPVLGDALEESGFANQIILSHCRSQNDHVLGCWVVGAALGKE
jgi:hypothetical protein